MVRDTLLSAVREGKLGTVQKIMSTGIPDKALREEAVKVAWKQRDVYISTAQAILEAGPCEAEPSSQQGAVGGAQDEAKGCASPVEAVGTQANRKRKHEDADE